jgi:hypothetical protein
MLEMFRKEIRNLIMADRKILVEAMFDGPV